MELTGRTGLLELTGHTSLFTGHIGLPTPTRCTGLLVLTRCKNLLKLTKTYINRTHIFTRNTKIARINKKYRFTKVNKSLLGLTGSKSLQTLIEHTALLTFDWIDLIFL